MISWSCPSSVVRGQLKFQRTTDHLQLTFLKMDKNVRRSGLALALAGLLGALFFCMTDPRYGLRTNIALELIDRVNEARIGTTVGIGGSVIVLLIGLWLMTRRAA